MEARESNTENNLINFDAQCHRPKNSKKVRKKMREVFDLGVKVENFVYPV